MIAITAAKEKAEPPPLPVANQYPGKHFTVWDIFDIDPAQLTAAELVRTTRCCSTA